jgi:hypothetical protein
MAGGAVHISSSSVNTTTLQHATFFGNLIRMPRFGGVIHQLRTNDPDSGLQGTSLLRVENTILHGNGPAEQAPIYNVGGGLLNVTSSLVQGGFTGTGNIDADPLFVNRTLSNLRLLPGSPALDSGAAGKTVLPFDIRGVTRPMGARVDMGAYEMRVFSATIGRPQTTTVGTSFAVLVVTVTNNGGEPVGPGGVVTFTPPASGPGLNTRTPFTRTTNAAGVATAPATANGVAGSYVVTVTVRGVPGVLRYALTNRATAKGRPPTADRRLSTADDGRQRSAVSGRPSSFTVRRLRKTTSSLRRANAAAK